MHHSIRRTGPAVLLLFAGIGATTELTISEGTNIAADVAPDGSVYLALLKGLWRIPPGGGTAARLPNQAHPAHTPRLHAGTGAIVYVAERQRHTELWLYDTAAERSTPVATRKRRYRQPDWHPDGERLVFAAAAEGRGFVLWEFDIASGLSRQLTHGPGEASWPAWSPDGRDLVYVRELDDRHELVLRRHAQADEVLLVSERRLSAPSFRPDKSLVAVLRHEQPIRIDMVILSQPRLVRPLIEDQDIFVARVAWMDRHRLVYTAGGRPRRLDVPESTSHAAIVRASRLFDGLGRDYRENVDILMRDGRIAIFTRRFALFSHYRVQHFVKLCFNLVREVLPDLKYICKFCEGPSPASFQMVHARNPASIHCKLFLFGVFAPKAFDLDNQIEWIMVAIVDLRYEVRPVCTCFGPIPIRHFQSQTVVLHIGNDPLVCFSDTAKLRFPVTVQNDPVNMRSSRAGFPPFSL